MFYFIRVVQYVCSVISTHFTRDFMPAQSKPVKKNMFIYKNALNVISFDDGKYVCPCACVCVLA